MPEITEITGVTKIIEKIKKTKKSAHDVNLTTKQNEAIEQLSISLSSLAKAKSNFQKIKSCGYIDICLYRELVTLRDDVHIDDIHGIKVNIFIYICVFIRVFVYVSLDMIVCMHICLYKELVTLRDDVHVDDIHGLKVCL
jgi:predicted DNA repair protein MutK